MINQAALPANRLVTERLARVGIRRPHYSLLATLDEGGPASQADLSRRTTVNELAGQGWVERAPDPTDRRRNVITITAAGRRHLRQLDRQLAKVQDEILAPLSPRERAQLIALLTRIIDHHAAKTSV